MGGDGPGVRPGRLPPVLLAQPADFPERLIGADPDLFLTHTLQAWCGTDGAITVEALQGFLSAP